MMCKARCTALLLAVLVLLGCLPLPAARAEVQQLLVLADAVGDEVQEGNLQELRRIMTYTSQHCEYADAWQPVDVSGYDVILVVLAKGRTLHEDTAEQLRRSEKPVFVVGDGVDQLAATETHSGSIVVRCETESGATSDLLLNRSELQLLAGETAVIGGKVYVDNEVYPLCKTFGNITHMAYCDAKEPLLAAALATYIQAWMWPYKNSPTSFGQYLVLDNVYPFYEPEDLSAITDMLREEGVPFAVTVMPVYANADYPSMKRFCEWLRYIQSTGVSIILHAPLVNLENVNMATYKKQLETAYSAYTLYGVYPVAYEAPEAYLFSKRGLEALNNFRTVLMFRSDDQLSDRTMGENLAWYDGHQLMAPYDPAGHALTTSYAQAIYLDPTEDVDELRRFVQTLKRSKRVLKDLTQMDHSIYIGVDFISSSALGVVEVNGKQVSLAYHPFVYEDYTFERGFEQYLTEQIQTSNKLIVFFVIGASTFFIIAIMMSRSAMRKDILHPKKYKPASTGKSYHHPE